MRRLVAGLVLLTALGLGGFDGLPARAASDDDAAANRLVVEAVRLAGEAGAAADPAVRADLLRQALDALDAIVERHPASGHAARLATGQPIGELDRAVVERRWFVARAQACVEAWDRRCFLALALDASSAIDDPDTRSGARMLIAVGEADAGTFERAVQISKSIGSPSSRAWALAGIAYSMARSGMVAEAESLFALAVESANAETDPHGQAWALASIASWRAEAGMPDGASALVERSLVARKRIFSPVYVGNALAAIAEAQAKLGYREESRDTRRQIERLAAELGTGPERLEILSWLAWVQAEVGDVAEALRTLARAFDSVTAIWMNPKWDRVVTLLTTATANTGEFDKALSVVATVETSYWRALAYGRIAETQARFGDSDGARRSVELALDEAAEVNSSASFADLLAEMSLGFRSQTKCGAPEVGC